MNKNNSLFLCIFLACIFSFNIVANLTTLQWWDPSPHYSANNFMMPSHSHIMNLRKAKQKDIKPACCRRFNISFSGLAQAACRARGCDGCQEFGTICGTAAAGKELGDFRGTLYGFGMFLGNSPNGNNIWANGIDNADIKNITPNSINGTQLPLCVKNVAKQLSGNFNPDTGAATESGDILVVPSQALMIGPIPDETSTSSPFNDLPTGPSIFSGAKLKQDTGYFGSFSQPIDYRKYAFRMEAHAEITKNIGMTIQAGLANIKHRALPNNPLGASPTKNEQRNTPFYSLSSTSESNSCDTITPNLTFQGVNGENQAPPSCNLTSCNTNSPSEAQTVYNDFFVNRFFDVLLSKECGLNQEIKDFDECSIEDVRFFLTFKESHSLDRYLCDEDDDDDWPEMLFTIYSWAGASAPAADSKDYDLYLSLPFGNNKHMSVGSGLGFLYDFAETVEVGVEAGFTYFIPRDEKRPFPNHPLQRGLYPFRAEVNSRPGINWHFKALLNAYQFMKHVNFWSTYEFIEHKKDEYRLCFDNTVKRTNPDSNQSIEERIFIPEVLECCSEWRAQFINLALVFDLHPGMQASLVWQQPITPRNAYYPVSVTGSLSFTF